jgi:hypothetical protein
MKKKWFLEQNRGRMEQKYGAQAPGNSAQAPENKEEFSTARWRSSATFMALKRHIKLEVKKNGQQDGAQAPPAHMTRRSSAAVGRSSAAPRRKLGYFWATKKPTKRTPNWPRMYEKYK